METFTFYSSGTFHRWCNFYSAWYPTIEAKASKGYPNASRTGLVVMFTFMLPVSRFVPFAASDLVFWSTIQYGLHRAGEAHRAHRHRMLLVVKKRGTALVFVFAVCIGNDFQPSHSVKGGPLELMHISKCTCNQKREKHHHFARERLEKMQHKSSFQVYANHCRRVDKKGKPASSARRSRAYFRERVWKVVLRFCRFGEALTLPFSFYLSAGMLSYAPLQNAPLFSSVFQQPGLRFGEKNTTALQQERCWRSYSHRLRSFSFGLSAIVIVFCCAVFDRMEGRQDS